jgi:prepilin-type N-terminal cleavage/methylation domain-containing protein
MIRKLSTQAQRGFTLIEVLVVIGILAILLAITLIAINPNKHFQDARNSQRSSNVSAVLDAIYAYEAANNGSQPPAVTLVSSTPTALARKAAVTATGTSFATPSLTYTVPSGNTVTAGDVVTVTSCTQAGDNGTFAVTSGTGTTIVVNDAGGSGTSATGCSIRAGVNLCPDLAPVYIADLPMDPSAAAPTGATTPCNGSTTAYDTGYTIALSNGRFTIAAPSAEGTAVITVTR